MRFQLVIFDLDGTLVHSLPDIAAALNAALAAEGRAPLPEAQVMTLVGEGVVRLAEKALAVGDAASAAQGSGARPDDVQRLADRVRDSYRQRPCVATRPFPGIVETLQALRAAPGRRLAVLTNKPGEVTRPLLQALELGGWFAEVVGDGDGYPPKPDPAGALALIQRLGARPEQTLIVGDGVPDLKLARATGAQVAAVGWGYNDREVLEALAPDFFLDRPADLLAIA